MTRVAIIGDASGHAEVLVDALTEVGIDPWSLRMPSDLVVIQVGDLVHKGPSGNQAVELADRMMRAHPSRWLQLIGNHDLAYVGGPAVPRWSDRRDVHPSTVRTLLDWWHRRRCLLAVGLETAEYGPVLVSHAGLTRGCWMDIGSPDLVADAATRLNIEVGQANSLAMRAGRLLGGPANVHAGPCWAEVSQEVYLPWIASEDLPFNQIHGHAAPWNFGTESFWTDTPASVKSRCTVDPNLRRVQTDLGSSANPSERIAISLDWQLGVERPPAIWPVFATSIDGEVLV